MRCADGPPMRMHMHLLLLTLLAVPASGGAVCRCLCCAEEDCSPVVAATNTLGSCSSCSASFCKEFYPSVCGVSEGHTSVACDGMESVTVRAEPMSDEMRLAMYIVLGIVGMVVLYCLVQKIRECCCSSKDEEMGETYATEYVPAPVQHQQYGYQPPRPPRGSLAADKLAYSQMRPSFFADPVGAVVGELQGAVSEVKSGVTTANSFLAGVATGTIFKPPARHANL